ncbi:hypothetical protein [Arachidicoccus rhizosphaerae]|nr:hypothetical protein [Arachidicoccus rhizosphaerae]
MKRKVREMNGSYGQGPFGQSAYNNAGTGENRSANAGVNVTGQSKGPFSRFTKQKAAGQAAKPSKSDYIDFEEVK